MKDLYLGVILVSDLVMAEVVVGVAEVVVVVVGAVVVAAAAAELAKGMLVIALVTFC